MEVHNGSIGVTSSYFRNSDGVILIYKKSDPLSLTQLPEWAKTAREFSKNCIFSLWCNNASEEFGSGPCTRSIIDEFTKSYEIESKLQYTYTTEDKTDIHNNFQSFIQHINNERGGNPVKSTAPGIIAGEDLHVSTVGRLKKFCKC